VFIFRARRASLHPLSPSRNDRAALDLLALILGYFSALADLVVRGNAGAEGSKPQN
jgi:hypothetical protein